MAEPVVDTSTTAAQEEGAPEQGSTSSFLGIRVASQPDLADLVLAAAALLLLIANAPGQYRGSPVLLTLVAFPLGGVGLVAIALLAVRGDRAARWAAAFLVWALVSTALSRGSSSLNLWFNFKRPTLLRS